MDSDEEPSRSPLVNEKDGTQYPSYPRFRNDPPSPYPGGDIERKTGDKIWRRGSLRLEEVNIAQISRAQITLICTIWLTKKKIEDGDSGPVQLDNTNDQEGAEGKSRRRGHPFAKVRKFMGGESVAVLQEKRTGRSKNRPESNIAENVVLEYPAGEERGQLGLDFPIAGHPEADSNIVGSFGDIYARLRTWSTSFATKQNIEQPNPSLMQVIRAIAPDVRKSHHVDRLDRSSRRHLVEAVVSSMIFSGIFESSDDENRASSSSVDLWMSRDKADSVHCLESAFKEGNRKSVSLRELNEWRALSIRLLSRICTDASSMELVQEKVQSLSDQIMDLLESWFPAEQSEDIRGGLARLIKACIELSRLLRQQRAYWFVTYKNGTSIDHSNDFDTNAMIDVDACDNEEVRWPVEGGEPNRHSVQPKGVRFKIFPGLFKRGNADGLQYDDEVCYAKIRVKLFEKTGGNTYS